MERVHAPARVRRRDRSIDIVDGDGGAERRDGGAAHARAVRGRFRDAVARVPAVVKMSAFCRRDAAAALLHEVGLDLRARRRVARHFFHLLGVLGAACVGGVLDGAPGLRAATAWSWRSRALPVVITDSAFALEPQSKRSPCQFGCEVRPSGGGRAEPSVGWDYVLPRAGDNRTWTLFRAGRPAIGALRSESGGQKGCPPTH